MQTQTARFLGVMCALEETSERAWKLHIRCHPPSPRLVPFKGKPGGRGAVAIVQVCQRAGQRTGWNWGAAGAHSSYLSHSQKNLKSPQVLNNPWFKEEIVIKLSIFCTLLIVEAPYTKPWRFVLGRKESLTTDEFSVKKFGKRPR